MQMINTNPIIRTLLLPFSWAFALVVWVRNLCYDKGILPSRSFDIPIVSVGNLAVGGTGKTPHIEYLVQQLSPNFKIAVLSRGYKRKTKGFVLANETSDAHSIGDEPFQIFRKFENVIVAVDEKRVRGIKRLLLAHPDIACILLDDAFQHRAVQPGYNIILTDYNKLYNTDKLLPAGTLREPQSAALRADAIVVTKCPAHLKPIDTRIVEGELRPAAYQKLFFSTFEYGAIYPLFQNDVQTLPDDNCSMYFVAGIVNPKPAFDQLALHYNVEATSFFPDHHNFSDKDFSNINKTFAKIKTDNKFIVTTEKDASRILSSTKFPVELKPYVFVLPIKVSFMFDDDNTLIKKIDNYVRKNQRNG